MGNGVCSRRQRKIFQSLLLVTVVFGIIYGAMVSYEMHKQLKRTEAMALKYQQHQESLSAQLQVVYEHRSRLEKSLQKERVEHKKAKEDYLVYKLESQQSLNKEKQDASSRFNSLHVQHQMLKNQHDDLKKQYYELQEQHQIQGEDHSRALEEHKERYEKLQQTKDLEMSKLKVENVYNLREENKQLRKAHQDIHIQLQDARFQHMDLKAAHDQLALTLEDHKSALATAQMQVDEFKKLKETLNRMPSLQHADQNHPQQQGQPAVLLDQAHEQDPPPAQQEALLVETHKEEYAHEDDHLDTQSKLDLQDKGEGPKMDPQSQLTISHNALPEKEGDVEGEGEAERRRELAEEEMEQAGQPQKLEEESDQPQNEEQEGVELEHEHELPDDNALDRQRRQPQPVRTTVESLKTMDPLVELHLHQDAHSEVERVKSAYEQQQEQQHLEAQRAQEQRALQLHQEALQAQREKEQREREQRLKEQQEKEAQHNKEADRQEQLLREEHLRRRSQYENMDNDIAQGEDDPHADEEEEKDTHLQPEEGDEKHDEEGHRVPVHQEGAVEGEVDPEDDPNNQGEDEFEEAEEQQPQHRAGEEEGDLPKHTDTHPNQPAVDEELVMAVNPDQQEDTLDEQEEGEDEVQEDLAGAQKREDEVEEEEEEGDPYNEENLEQDEVKEQAEKEAEHRKETENNDEENYEEEEEEEVVVGRGKHTNRRAEM
ncbi:Golgi integral membrane protein 4a isoform X5 [Hypomesus transpacificus]|uniref:Golgi integral membrane protein 4a isoform X5 n=1 Tax=Hypomesus transpacificus TaxID=137520 RepID=UPI001F0759C6|nr:Golgi integral membrane protein 4a isoform X5 [Hypomesus transpacificus]